MTHGSTPTTLVNRWAIEDGKIKTRHFPRFALVITLSGLLFAQQAFSAAAFAERYAPQLELESPFDTEEEAEVFTPVQELEDISPGYLQMQFAAPSPEATVPTLKGKVDVEKEFVPDIVYGEVETLEKGEYLILTIMDFIASGYSQYGDEFNARVKVEVTRDGKVLIPQGALVKGHVAQTEDPGKSLGKQGKVILAFDYILMPDGRKVPFKSQVAKGDSALKAVGRAVAGGIGGTIGGAIRGVLVGLKFGGLQGAALTNGGTLIAGGSLGALTGLGRGLSQSGDHVLFNEGDEIKVALQESLELPSMILPPDTENEIHAAGLDVNITGYTLGRDPFKSEKVINLQLEVKNQTDYQFGSFDLALMDEYNQVYSLSPFGDDGMFIFQIQPNSQFSGKAAFSVMSPELKHYLVFYKPYTREVVAKVSLREALKHLSKKQKSNIATRKH